MNDVADVTLPADIEYIFCRGDIVSNEGLRFQVADLCLQHDHNLGTIEQRLPVTALGQVGVVGNDVRVQLPEYVEIRPMLIDNGKIVVAPVFKMRYKILSYQACASGQYDF